MALKLSLEQKLTQQLVMTPQLRQLIELLPLSRLELENRIRVELENNPLLEQEAIPEEFASAAAQRTSEKAAPNLDDIEGWFRYLEDTPVRRASFQSSEEHYTVEPCQETSMREDLVWQIHMSKMTAEQKEIAWKIIGNLDPDGYLRLPMPELEKLTEAKSQAIEKVINTIQQLDPPGIAARNLVECLLIQAEINYPENYPLIEKILKLTLRELESHRYKDIAKKLKVKEKTVRLAVSQIKSLAPHPGQEFFAASRYYITPDAEIIEEDGDYKIVLNEHWESSLKINPYYRQLLRKKKEFTPDERKFLEEKYQSACHLLEGLQRRHNTLYNVLESILKVQRGFFEQGISCLAPLTLKDVASEVGVHETTVSRITRKKYVQTPRGLLSLKFFFGRGLKHGEGEVAAKSVMDKVRNLIDHEDANNPLSDQKIAKLLQREGVRIARRTVGKYRKLLKIDSTQRRRRLKKLSLTIS